MSNATSLGKAGLSDSDRSFREPSRIPLLPLGISLSGFLAISYLACIAAGIFGSWDWGLHQPWLQFLPGFNWLTWPSFFLGLGESILYGWYAALLFGGIYNFVAARLDSPR
jgi:hypothetical protein